MSDLIFPVQRVGMVANFAPSAGGYPQMEVAVNMTQSQMRVMLNQIARNVDGETLADWLFEDLEWQVTEVSK